MLGDLIGGAVEGAVCGCCEKLWTYVRGGDAEEADRPRHRRQLPRPKDEPSRAATRDKIRARRDAAVARRRRR